MKDKIIAIILFVLVVGFVVLNTVILNEQIDTIYQGVSALDVEDKDATDKAEALFSDFCKKEKYISITVSHDDLTNIEDCFVEMIGHLSINNTEDAKVTKDRLTSFLEHLRRLSGFTIDAII